MPGSGSTRALIGAAILLVVAACGSGTAAVASPAASATAAPPSPTPSPTPTASPSSAAGGQVFDTTSIGPMFDLPMTLMLPAGWIALPPPSYGAIHTFGYVEGEFGGDDSQWWGPGFALVDGASVLDPIVLDPSFVGEEAKLPWPASYIDYLLALPGVTVVSPPADVTVGGLPARSVTVTTPPMHATIFIKDDTMWLGGGWDLVMTRQLIVLTVHGRRLLYEFDMTPDQFASHLPRVDAILDTVEFQ